MVAGARAAGLLVVLDVKRGDVGSTNAAYAEAFLGAGAPLAADAVTVHPYLGLGGHGRLRRAGAPGRQLPAGGHPCSRTPRGGPCSPPATGPGRQVDEELLRDGELNRTLAPGGVGPVGAVVGPAFIEPELDLRGAQALFLSPSAPGVGAQGATPRELQPGSSCPARTGSCPARPGRC